MINRLRGFSLVELLITLIILSIILLTTSSILTSSVESDARVSQTSEQIASFQIASALIRRDFNNLKEVLIVDQLGERTENFLILENNPTKIVFVTKDFFQSSYPGLTRIEYVLAGEALTRIQYPSDQPYNNTGRIETILSYDVNSLTISAFDGDSWQMSWGNNDMQNNSLPNAIKLNYVNSLGTFEYVIELNENYYEKI